MTFFNKKPQKSLNLSKCSEFDDSIKRQLASASNQVKMDEYEKKLKELRTYVPFLTKMIDKLEKAGDKSKEAQLAKMKSLKGILTASNKKLQLETLEKCEGVLHKLYEQVEGPVDTKSSSKNQQNVSQKVQQRPRSPPKEERSSLSSYLQQLHDSQHEQSQQSRFSQGKPCLSNKN